MPLIELRGITKKYGAVVALDSIDFHIDEGEVIGLLGDNGAGKSTLIKILSGIVQPTSGTILYQGKETKIPSRRDSYKMGLETIYQDIALVDQMDIVRNIFLGREETGRLGFMDMKSMKMDTGAAPKAVEAGYWTCTMHPEVHATASGSCPKCGMTLVYKKNEATTKGNDQQKMKM